jgi:hypothetical protein
MRLQNQVREELVPHRGCFCERRRYTRCLEKTLPRQFEVNSFVFFLPRLGRPGATARGGGWRPTFDSPFLTVASRKFAYTAFDFFLVQGGSLHTHRLRGASVVVLRFWVLRYCLLRVLDASVMVLWCLCLGDLAQGKYPFADGALVFVFG